ncbi:MAG: hypothetical protein H6742_04115 [Alphaproteobacteria bacterium]|nr:hypothetical protein [Alphaproteobacteria bacterium]
MSSARPDPRRVLREAAERRVPCELLPRGGEAVRGAIVRVEQAGVVVVVPAGADGRRLSGGEDVRVWLAVDGRACSFEASVIRAGVPVPDRSQDGVLLGFIDRWQEGGDGPVALSDCTVELLPPNGPAVSLLAPPARVVDVTLRELAFTVPASFPLVFVREGTVRVRLGLPGRAPVSLSARVRTLSPGEGYLLYGLHFESVDDPDALRDVVEGLGERL